MNIDDQLRLISYNSVTQQLALLQMSVNDFKI